MNLDEEKIKNSLEELFKKASFTRKLEDLNELKLVLDDYLDQGYNLKSYMFRYNSLVQDNFKLKVF
jgi:hypothetical protein